MRRLELGDRRPTLDRMTTLNDIRDRLRRDLRDNDEPYRWDDGQLDRHIARALADLSLASPRELSALVATTPGSRALDVSGLEGLIAIEAIEYPAGRYPPAYMGFSHWAETVTLHTDGLPDGSDAQVHYVAAHALDGDGGTVPAALEDTLATGAAAYAALEYAAYAIDRLTTGDRVAEQYAAWGRAWLAAFRELLRQHGRERRLSARRLFMPA